MKCWNSTFRLPTDGNLLPTMANGHIGFTVFSDEIYMNGLYNGRGGLSHRARIPNFNKVRMAVCESDGENPQQTACQYKLNVRSGVFSIEYEEKSKYKIVQHIYPHRYHNRAIVNQFFIQRIDDYHGKHENMITYYISLILNIHICMSGFKSITNCMHQAIILINGLITFCFLLMYIPFITYNYIFVCYILPCICMMSKHTFKRIPWFEM